MGRRDYVRSKYGVIGWKNKLSGLLVTVEQTSLRGYGNAYIVKSFVPGKKYAYISKKFKTIKQATTHAEAFMRKH